MDLAGVTLRKRSLRIARHRTSISLEDAFWEALGEAARRRGATREALVAEIDAARVASTPGGRPPSLASAVRVFLLREGPWTP